MYLFTWESPALDGALGSCHALEIPFVWNTLTPGSDGFTGAGPEAESLAHEMHEAWIAFAAAGDPGWERYEEGRRATRVFGPGAGTAEDPRGALRQLWEQAPDSRAERSQESPA
jgi:para-nitrobenzyl esterase